MGEKSTSSGQTQWSEEEETTRRAHNYGEAGKCGPWREMGLRRVHLLLALLGLVEAILFVLIDLAHAQLQARHRRVCRLLERPSGERALLAQRRLGRCALRAVLLLLLVETLALWQG